MKQIYDAIREHFAFKPRSYAATSSTLNELHQFQRHVRGYSHQLAAITGLDKVTPEQALRARAFRTKLRELLFALSRTPSWKQEASTLPLLSLKDATGYLRSTTQDLLRDCVARQGSSLHLCIDSWGLVGTSATFTCSFRPTWGLPQVRLGQFKLEDLDLDTLAGALDALARMARVSDAIVQQASKHPAMLKWKQDEADAAREAQERNARLRDCFARLSPSDREFCRRALPYGSVLAPFFP